MKIPKRIQSLVEDGLVDAVIRQLMSDKEAMVFVVRCGEEIRCAKVYKEANQRSFRQAVDYTEGRKTTNSRQARAMAKSTRYGRKVQEQAWQSAEVDAASNNYAAAMLERDVGNLTNFFGRFAPELLATEYGKEIWALYEHGALHSEVELTGRFKRSVKPVDLGSVVRVIDDARAEDAARRLRLQG